MKITKLLIATCLLAGRALSQTATTGWDVVAGGAKGDGATDNTALFQRVLDEAGKAGGGVVTVPAGRFRINGVLNIPANVTLQGIYRVPPTTGPTAISKKTSAGFPVACHGAEGAP